MFTLRALTFALLLSWFSGTCFAQQSIPSLPVPSPVVKTPLPDIKKPADERLSNALKQPMRINIFAPGQEGGAIVRDNKISVHFKAYAAWGKDLSAVQYAIAAPSGPVVSDIVCQRQCGSVFEFNESIDLQSTEDGPYRIAVQIVDTNGQTVSEVSEFVLTFFPVFIPDLVLSYPRPGYQLIAQEDLMEPHPRLAPLPAIHFDHYNSSVTDAPIPDFGRFVVQEKDFAGGFSGTGACLNFMVDDRDNLIGFCGHRDNLFQVRQAEYRITLLNKTTFEQMDDITVAEDIMLGSHGCEDASDDRAPLYLGYFVMDNEGRALITMDDNVTHFIRVTNDRRELETVDRIDFNSLRLPGMRADFRLDDEANRVAQVIPDYEDGYWFMGQGTSTSSSFVGHINGRRQVDFFKWLNSYGAGEEKIENGMAIDSTGLYVLSDHALYKFKIARGRGQQVFRHTYDRAHPDHCKPGTFAHRGSGSTPTLLGNDLVAFTDNADGRVNVVVVDRRDEAGPRGREICKVPVFADGASANENSLIGYNNSLIVQNWFGAPKKITWNTQDMEPGIWRIDVSPDRSSCRVVWNTDDISSTATARLSTKTGLIYFPVENWDAGRLELAALDFQTGHEAAPRLFLGNIDLDALDYHIELRRDQPDNEQIMMLPLYVLQNGELVQPVYAGVKRIFTGFR